MRVTVPRVYIQRYVIGIQMYVDDSYTQVTG